MIQFAGDQAFFFILISVCLGACFAWAIWEIEEGRRYLAQRRETVNEARNPLRPIC
jgi:hypothetical protein